MAENSKIQWTTHTMNPWRGCTKIAPGCQNCYADSMSKRNHKTLGVWGPNGTRVVAAESAWKQPLKWDRLAKEAGERHRVFCASLADIFEGWDGPMLDAQGNVKTCHVSGVPIDMQAVRRRLFDLIDATPNLDWLLVTKRPENIRRMWHGSKPKLTTAINHKAGTPEANIWHRPNAWLLTSVSDQATADVMIPHLLQCRDLVPVLGLSCEPLLGPVDLSKIVLRKDGYMPNDLSAKLGDWIAPLTGAFVGSPTINWCIVGGESGHGARLYDVAWARSIIRQCKAAGVPVFHKQMGANVFAKNAMSDGFKCFSPFGDGFKVHLDDPKGGDMSEWPEDLRVREYPTKTSVTT